MLVNEYLVFAFQPYCKYLVGYILDLFVVIWVHVPCFYLIFDFYCLVHTFDDRSLFTLFRFKH